jgi:hypothetical protein
MPKQIVASDATYAAADAAIAAGRLAVVTWTWNGKAHLATPHLARSRTLCGCHPLVANVSTTRTTADMCQRCMAASQNHTTPDDWKKAVEAQEKNANA